MDGWISLLLQLRGGLRSYKSMLRKSQLAHTQIQGPLVNTFEGTDDWHKRMYNTQGACHELTTMHTPMDVRRAVTVIPFPLLPQCAKGGPTRPIPLRAANTFLHLLPPTPLLLICSLQGAHTHTGFHTGEVAECRTLLISLQRAVVLLTSDKCNSNLGSLFSPMN